MKYGVLASCVCLMLSGMSSLVCAQTEPASPAVVPNATTAETEADLVSYPAEYFAKFKPLTALDMVTQVPGFALEVIELGTRGLAEAAGNLLINDSRPSAKQDQPSAILSRIPAGNVERVELIRGQVRGIDLQGKPSMINVILREDSAAAIKWEAAVLKPFTHGPFTPSLNVSLSDNWHDIEYNTGASIYKNSFGRTGVDRLLDGKGNNTENRYDDRENRSTLTKGNFNASTTLDNGTQIKLNTVLSNEERRQFLSSRRVPLGVIPHIEEFVENFDKPIVEIGFDAEHSLGSDLIGKAILLYYHADESSYKSQKVFNTASKQSSFRLAEGDSISTELITRAEFDWTRFRNHTLQMNLERAYNSLDGALKQTLDIGIGPVAVAVPGSNSFVKEIRWDGLLQDTWSSGTLQLDAGLGAEASTLTQTGDADQQRDFFFLKPQTVLTWSPAEGRQTRMRLAREVSQLVLTDFVSATVFEENDLALGNPDIQPETTWVAELTQERRFGKISVIRVKAFHHWITDVLDLLPLTPSFEVPGNIGKGRRWGLELESTVPLGSLGLTGARLDFKARWQDSTVVDPVTGKDRILSSVTGDFPITYNVENKAAINLDYRQDFEASRLAWGWTLLSRARRTLYKVNELEINNEKVELGMFVETTRWFGVKMRLATVNLLESPGVRERTVFTGERDLSPIRFQELRERLRGRSATLTISRVY